ncbi:MAG TPA: GNAT family N-acetyltransferase [Vulgatibacter sp.]|nr:GNAT family N-acetyltransferase [Vulgatibacter sp.]
MRLPEIEERRGHEAVRELEGEWKALARRAGAAPFLSWEWIEPWLRHLEPQRTPRLICARDAGRLVGLLALGETRRRIPGLGWVVRLGFLGERRGGADYLDVLAGGADRERATRAILCHLAEARDHDVLELDGIACDSPTLEPLRAAFAASAEVTIRETERYTCPQIALQGGFERVLSRSSRADNFRRRLRKARAMAGFEHRVVREEAGAAAAFERFLDLHERRWAGQGGSDAMGMPAARRFHREVVASLARAGVLHFDELWIDGGCRASIYGIDGPGVFYFFQTGYDPAWASSSVGLVLLGLSIEAAIGRGALVYDFLHGTEPYKLEWATGTRQTAMVRIARAGFGAAVLLAREAAEAMARQAARSILPEGAVEALRRRRRARERAGL